MEFLDLLLTLVKEDGSDLYFSTGAPPSMKVLGKLTPITDKPYKKGEIMDIAYSIMDADQIAEFEHKPEMNLAISEKNIGRFRVNIFKQRSDVAMVVRAIKTEIPHFRNLGLPDIVPKLVLQKRGLVLFVGGTGSGKSTSLASLIDYRNTHTSGHIITIEDPVEFLHPHKKSIVNQREVGVDTDSYEDALQNTLRQAPDVILIGEIRSRETMEHALAFAETGHLCLSTLHANNANQALERIINFFPEERHKQLYLDLSLNLRGIISQRLVPTVDDKRAAAIEVLLATPRVIDLIKSGKVTEIREVMEKSENQGMKTFDSALCELYDTGKITLQEALLNADSRNNLRLKIQLQHGNSPPSVVGQVATPNESATGKPDVTDAPAAPAAPQKRSVASGEGLSLEPIQVIEEETEEEEENVIEENYLVQSGPAE